MSRFESPSCLQDQLLSLLLQTGSQCSIRRRLHGILANYDEDSRVWISRGRALRWNKSVSKEFRKGLNFVGFCNGSMCTPYFDGAIGRQEVFAPALPVFLLPQDVFDYKYSVNVNWLRVSHSSFRTSFFSHSDAFLRICSTRRNVHKSIKSRVLYRIPDMDASRVLRSSDGFRSFIQVDRLSAQEAFISDSSKKSTRQLVIN